MTVNNKQIAKNAIMLYIRMLLSVAIGLYTSRVVLQVLGVEDFGIYGVVGGIVAMMSFLNASMSGATSRFITFELGKGDTQRLKDTFSSALIIHIFIAFIVFILAETIGLWFLYNKLIIPESRMTAALWVYQFSVIAAMLNITQVPYNACIIAHEKMDVYAYIEILNVSLKLGIVYLLVIGNYDKLILYAVLVFLVSFIIMTLYRLYSMKHFKESHFRFIWNKPMLKSLLSFTGWDLYGNACVSVRQQRTNFLINIFFGVIYNAASGVATTINSTVNSLVRNVAMAFRPQIIKLYAVGDIKQMQTLSDNAVKYMTILMGCISLPIFFEMEYLMTLWLGNVPEKAIEFCQLMMISGCIITNNSIFSTVINATGNIKRVSMITGTVYLLTIPAIWLAYNLSCSIEWAYILGILFDFGVILSNLSIIKYQIPQFKITATLRYMMKSYIVIILPVPVLYYIVSMMDATFVRLLTVGLSCIVIILFASFTFLLDKESRTLIKNKLCQKFQ